MENTVHNQIALAENSNHDRRTNKTTMKKSTRELKGLSSPNIKLISIQRI